MSPLIERLCPEYTFLYGCRPGRGRHFQNIRRRRYGALLRTSHVPPFKSSAAAYGRVFLNILPFKSSPLYMSASGIARFFPEKLFNFVQCVLCNLADIPPFLPRRHTKKLPRRRHAAHEKGSFCLIQFRVHLTEVVHRSITLRFPFFGSRNKLELCTCSSCSFCVFFRESVFCCRSSVSFV